MTCPKILQTRPVSFASIATANLKEAKAVRRWGEALAVVTRTWAMTLGELRVEPQSKCHRKPVPTTFLQAVKHSGISRIDIC